MKPFFRDIDRLSSSTGFVTKPQFRRCLAYMTCELSDAEFNVICKKWAKKMPVFGIPLVDSKPSPEKFTYMREAGSSICYVSFLDEVDRRIEEMVKISSDFGEGISGPELVKPASPSKAVSSNQVKEDFDRLMMKIKIKAKTERIRVVDFLADFDHLRHGKITRNEFRRATKIIFDGLTDSDLSLLETRFEVPGEPDHVNYLKFSDAVESVFTKKGLEKNPTDEPGTFDVYSNGWLADPYEPTLTEEEHVILVSVMERLNERVKSRRVDALIYMEDYDFVNEGTSSFT